VIFGEKNGFMLPCVYALCSSKSKEMYVELFKQIKLILIGDLDVMISTNHYMPQVCLTDFELAIMTALASEFSGITLKGCFFHFKQAIHRWISNHNYKTTYKTNNTFRIWINKLGALALIPIDKIDIAWANIKNQKIDGINLQPIRAYFESTWLNVVEQFKPLVWNHFDFIGPKTNNDLEAFNRKWFDLSNTCTYYQICFDSK